MVEEKKVIEKWGVSDVPTQTTPMVVDNENQEAYNVQATLALMLNKLEKIEAFINN